MTMLYRSTGRLVCVFCPPKRDRRREGWSPARVRLGLESPRQSLVRSPPPQSHTRTAARARCHVVRNGATEAVLDLRCWKWRDQKGLESRICCKYENVGWASASSLIFTASNRM